MSKELIWRKALNVSNKAISQSSLCPIKTILKSHKGFEVRVLDGSLRTKKSIYGPKMDPFRPWEVNLEVDKIGRKHVLILNKYPVEIGHLLLITKDWQPQNGWLAIEDFASICTIENDTKGLWFFNNSKESGASQPHRHIQLLRRPDINETCPRHKWFEGLKDISVQKDKILKKSIGINLRDRKTPEANNLYNSYIELCSRMNIGDPNKDRYPLIPYNLLITSDWIVLIRRRKERAHDISINALGFAGYFFAKNRNQYDYIVDNGADEILRKVVLPL